MKGAASSHRQSGMLATDSSAERVGVLLMALGGPDSLESVGPYLQDLRGGRPTPPALIDEITERYRVTGGKSPVLAITRELAGKLPLSLRLPLRTDNKGRLKGTPAVDQVQAGQ